MSYATQADVENTFGSQNVQKWADANNNGNGGEIAARITWALTKADNTINGKLRYSRYTIPFTVPYPVAIVDLAAELAGLYLHNFPRAFSEGDEAQAALSEQMDDCMKRIAEIKSGQFKLEIEPAVSQHPSAMNGSDDECWLANHDEV